jgi:hypothetical protein
MIELALPFIHDYRRNGIIYEGIVPLKLGQVFNGYNEDNGDGPYKLKVVKKWLEGLEVRCGLVSAEISHCTRWVYLLRLQPKN